MLKPRDTYRGGRLVLGTGSSWPHDFRFFTCFLSDCDCGSTEDDRIDPGVEGVRREVSAREMVGDCSKKLCGAKAFKAESSWFIVN